MKAVLLDRFGGPEALRIAGDVAAPEPGPDQVLIRVAYAGVNPADFKECAGQLGAVFGNAPLPYIPGYDASGVVERVGASVTQFRVGDRVMTPSDHLMGDGGSFAEFVRVRGDNVGLMPRSASFAEAAAIPVAARSGWQALFAPEKGALKAGERVLFHGAAGGVGSFAVQFAKAQGLRVAATCRTENVAYVEGLGADCVIDYRRADIAAEARAWAPDGFDAVIDAVSNDTLPNAVALLRRGGRLVQIATGTVDGDIEGVARAAAAVGCKHVFAICNFANGPAELGQIAALIDAGKVRMPPVQSFPLEELSRALNLVGTLHTQGKLAVKIADLA